MYCKVIVACGHLGRKNEVEVTRFFEASNALEAWESAMIMPRAKKQQRSRCIRYVEEIDAVQYLNGKLAELKNPYLMRRKKKAS